MKNKKAELTSKHLVILILLVIAFAMILLFWNMLNPKGEIDKEVCHNSVVLRSSFNYGALEVGKKAVPLRCKTEKICLSMSGENCEEFGESIKEYPVNKIKLDDDKTVARKEIKDALAVALYDCHSMLGEGKLDFMPHEFKDKNYCLICSRIVLDEQAKEEIEDIPYGEFYQYLEQKQTPQGESFLKYVYSGWTSWKDSQDLFKNLKEQGEIEGEKEGFENLDFEDWKIALDKKGGYAVIAQMRPEGTLDKWLATAGTAIGGTAITLIGAASIPISGPVGVAIAVTGAKIGLAGTAVASGAVFWYTHPSGKYEYSPPSIYPYDLDALEKIRCYSFETAPA